MGKRIIFVCFSLLIITGWLFGSTTSAFPESLKCKAEAPPPERKAHEVDLAYWVGVNTKEGTATCDNGETASFKSYEAWNAIANEAGLLQGYLVLTFKDNSKIVTQFKNQLTPDRKGKAQWLSDGSYEITRGTIRFTGIKGTAVSKGHQLSDRSSTLEISFNYTLNP